MAKLDISEAAIIESNRLVRSRMEGIIQTSQQEVKKLLLEQLAVLKPFPQMEVGVVRSRGDMSYEKTEKVEGILLRDTAGPKGSLISLAHACVLKPDGAYWYTGLCLPKSLPSMWELFHDNFLVSSMAQARLFYYFEYIENAGNILTAIENAGNILTAIENARLQR